MIFSRKHLSNAINSAVFPAFQGGPHNHQIAAIAVALREASTPEFVEYIRQVKQNAVALATGLQSYGYTLVTNGTENHSLLWDVRPTGLNGAKLEKLFEFCDISENKNSVRGDISALTPGGIRIGTPTLTTRGMKAAEMTTIATLFHQIVVIGQKIQEYGVEKYLGRGWKSKSQRVPANYRRMGRDSSGARNDKAGSKMTLHGHILFLDWKEDKSRE